MLLFEEHARYKSQLAEVQKNLLRVESQIYEKHQTALDAKTEGTVNIVDGDYKIKVIKRLNRTIDQEKAAELNGLGLVTKFSWSKVEYSKLTESEKLIANEAITTKVGKPTFSLEKTDA